MKRRTVRLICFPIIGFIVALFLAITIALGLLKDIITPLLSPPIVDEKVVAQASEEGEALAEEIMTEGAVLVKNNGVLPWLGNRRLGQRARNERQKRQSLRRNDVGYGVAEL